MEGGDPPAGQGQGEGQGQEPGPRKLTLSTGNVSKGAAKAKALRLPSQVEMLERMYGQNLESMGRVLSERAVLVGRDSCNSNSSSHSLGPPGATSSNSTSSSDNSCGHAAASSSSGSSGSRVGEGVGLGGSEGSMLGSEESKIVVHDYSWFFNEARSAKTKGRSSIVPRYGTDAPGDVPSKHLDVYVAPQSPARPSQPHPKSIFACCMRPPQVAA